MYNYYEAVKNDVKKYIKNKIDLNEWKGDRDGLEEKLNDDLWDCDSVTGNGSGGYTNRWQAEENICQNLDLLGEALRNFGYGVDFLSTHGAKTLDVTIRCYLLDTTIAEVLDELEGELQNMR